MKVQMIVEQFDNGYSFKASDTAGNVEGVVALDKDAQEVLGKMIFADINNVMNSEFSSVVTIDIEYKIRS